MTRGKVRKEAKRQHGDTKRIYPYGPEIFRSPRIATLTSTEEIPSPVTSSEMTIVAATGATASWSCFRLRPESTRASTFECVPELVVEEYDGVRLVLVDGRESFAVVEVAPRSAGEPDFEVGNPPGLLARLLGGAPS